MRRKQKAIALPILGLGLPLALLSACGEKEPQVVGRRPSRQMLREEMPRSDDAQQAAAALEMEEAVEDEEAEEDK